MPPISRRAMLYGTAAATLTAAPALGQNRSSNGAGQNASTYPAPPARGAIAADTQWTAFAGDNRAHRYSPLDQISAANFNNLQLAWRFDAGKFGPRIETNWEGTPLLVKGRLYVTAGSRRDVLCLDAITGEFIWAYRLDEGRRGVAAPRALSGRGVSYWTDGKVERIFYVTPGYRLVALNMETGQLDTRFGRNGMVDLKLENDQTFADLDTAEVGWQASPLVAGNVIVVGAAHTSGSQPRAVSNVHGNVRGYDARTGRRLWIFHTIPHKGEFGYDTWLEAGQAEKTGNAGVWGNMCADEELGLVYFGVELPTGDYMGMYRKGPALYGESIVALDLKTGRRRWHYQTIHHGLWDRDIPCQAMIVDIPVGGRTVKAIAQPTKQSYLYVLDRATGEPVWPIPEVPQPAGDVPDEWYSPTQPIPSRPPAYDRQSVLDDDLVDFTPAIKARALEIAGHYNRGGIYYPPTLSTADGKWGTLMLPGAQGGTNWPGGAFDPETSIAYVYSKTTVFMNGLIKNPNPGPDSFAYVSGNAPGQGGRSGGGGGEEGGGGGAAAAAAAVAEGLTGPLRPGVITVAGLPIVKPPYGRISALDLKDGTMPWQVAHGETPDNIRTHPLLRGLTIPRTGQPGNVGPLVTKTLVICGDPLSTTNERGQLQGWLRAYDKATGREVGAVPMPEGQTGTPMTYAMGGWQYIVLCVGNSPTHGSEMVAYRLRSI